MFYASMFFLGLSVCIFAGLLCFALAKVSKREPSFQPFPSEKAAWNQIKTAIMDLYTRFDHSETPKQKSLRSWTGTLVICAGLCLIGVLLEVQYNQPITVGYLASCYVGEPPASKSVPVAETSTHAASTSHAAPTTHSAKPTK